MAKPTADREQTDRRERLAAMRTALLPFLTDNPLHAAANLVDLASVLVREAHPQKLTPNTRASIQETYPRATADLIKERATSAHALNVIVAMAHQMMTIAMDYCPDAAFKAVMAADESLSPDPSRPLSEGIRQLGHEAREAGLSEFGVLCVTVLTGVHDAKALPEPIAIRPLLDAMAMISRRTPPPVSAEREEEILQQMMEMLACGRAEAKRYMRMAKEQIRDGNI